MRGAGCPRVTQPFATLCTPEGALTVRLACVKRAASVHPEPGSNSPFKNLPACAGEIPFESVPFPPGRISAGSVIHEKFWNFGAPSPLSRLRSSLFASLSSSISSIAVSGFQGSPRGPSAPREEVIYARPRAAGPRNPRLHGLSTSAPGTPGDAGRPPAPPAWAGPGACRARGRKCPSLVSDVLLSHGLPPQYHRRSGA